MARKGVSVGAIVLAAGRSTRMEGTNKLLADLNGMPVVARTVAAIDVAGLPPPVIVTGHMATAVEATLKGALFRGAGLRGAGLRGTGLRGDLPTAPARFVVAPDFANGLSRSLAAGLAAAPPDWHAALIVLGDMPRVLPATLVALAAAATDGDAVVVPVHGGSRGNPVAWGRAHWPRLAALTGDRGARALLCTVRLTEVATADAGIFADVDTPAALAALRA